MSSSRSALRKLFLALPTTVAATLLVSTVAHGQAPAAQAPPAAELGAWHEGDPVPPGYHGARRARTWLVAGGASLFVLPYLASSLVASMGYDSNNGMESARAALWLPVAGPFIQMGHAKAPADEALLLLDGLAQAGGLTLFIYGLAAPRTVLVRDEIETHAKISLAPLVAPGAAGAVLAGTF